VIRLYTLIILLLFAAASAHAQCAPGIPSAGNPGCIPPNQPNSPYYQGPADSSTTRPEAAPIYADRWGAFALDADTGSAGFSTDATSKTRATNAALADCSADGSKNCKVLTSYYNQCASIAQDPNGGSVFAATSPSLNEAKATSLKNCGSTSCKVFYSACVQAERVN
jgi:hypothetical protein